METPTRKPLLVEEAAPLVVDQCGVGLDGVEDLLARLRRTAAPAPVCGGRSPGPSSSARRPGTPRRPRRRRAWAASSWAMYASWTSAAIRKPLPGYSSSLDRKKQYSQSRLQTRRWAWSSRGIRGLLTRKPPRGCVAAGGSSSRAAPVVPTAGVFICTVSRRPAHDPSVRDRGRIVRERGAIPGLSCPRLRAGSCGLGPVCARASGGALLHVVGSETRSPSGDEGTQTRRNHCRHAGPGPTHRSHVEIVSGPVARAIRRGSSRG